MINNLIMNKNLTRNKKSNQPPTQKAERNFNFLFSQNNIIIFINFYFYNFLKLLSLY